MSLRHGLQGLARTVMSAKSALPQRSGAGMLIKPSALPDKPVSLCLNPPSGNNVAATVDGFTHTGTLSLAS